MAGIPLPAALAALLLAVSLILEAAVRQAALGRGFAVTGLAFLVAAILAPYRPRSPEVHVSERPHFGFTRHGMPVHARTLDHHKDGTAYQRFNKRVALALTAGVGTMTTFWLFCLLALCSLPSVLSAFAPFAHTFPAWAVKVSIIALVAWMAQTLIQLVLLPALMTGQNLQNVAADARAAKTFEDVEAVKADLITALDRLDVDTEGGIRSVLDAVNALASREVLEQKVGVQTAAPLSDVQVKQMVTAVQASILQQAKQSRRPGGGIGA